MYRALEDFIEDWTTSAAGTLAVMKAITDEKMNVAIVEGHNTLAWLSWHLIGTAGLFGRMVGFNVPAIGRDEAIPDTMAAIVGKYEEVMAAYASEVKKLTDDSITEEVNGFNGPIARGKILRILIEHQTHHRGQMTVLLRQAGLTVPGVMGPTKEMQS